MSARRIVPIVAALAAAGLLLLLWPKGEQPPEEQVRRVVVSMTRYAEEKDVQAILEHVSDRFRADQGMGKQELKQYLAAQLFRNRWVRVFTTDLEVKATSPTTVEMTGRFIFGRSDAKTLEELAKESVVDSYQIDARFEREEDGVWRAAWAKYRRADPM